uniref:hypothetical protein n=1 Tax=Rhizobium laguerreae TaxID=1076926 RepID=UPI0021B12A53|nr:hypothetical protein [Rhizobium laguerreae]
MNTIRHSTAQRAGTSIGGSRAETMITPLLSSERSTINPARIRDDTRLGRHGAVFLSDNPASFDREIIKYESDQNSMLKHIYLWKESEADCRR